MLRSIFLWLGIFLAGCDSPPNDMPSPNLKKEDTSLEAASPGGQAHLDDAGEVFDLLIEDFNEDGFRDVMVVDHSGNEARLHLQETSRVFKKPLQSSAVGFHPGTFIVSQHNPLLVTEGCEGENAIKSFSFDPVTGLKEVSSHPMKAPRFIEWFHWPEWGRSIVAAPYENGYLEILRGFDPLSGATQGDFILPLSDNAKTIREAVRVRVADLDGDHTDELVTVDAITNEVLAFQYPGKEQKRPPKPRLLGSDPSWGMPNDATILDLDGDGDLDLLVADEVAPGRIHPLLNQGKMKFSKLSDLIFPGDRGVLELRAGIDQDGFRYLAAAGYGAIALYQIPKNWKDGDPIPRRDIPWRDDLSFDMELVDVDGDDWLDLVLGRTLGPGHVWIAYGPLWDRFEQFGQSGFVLQ